MPAFKPLTSYDDDDLIQMVGEDFDASEYDRSERNERNFQAYRMFHCRDLISQTDLAPQRDDIVSGRMPYWELGAIQHNHAYIPWLRGVALTSVARIAHAMWPDFNDFYRVDPDDPEDEKAAKAAYGLTRYFIRASKYKKQGMLALLGCHIFDFSILYTSWMRQSKLVPRLIPAEKHLKDFETGFYHPTGELDEDKTEIGLEEIVGEGWDVSSINTMNFRHDPLAGDEDFGEFCGLTCLIPKREMWDSVENDGWDRSACEEIDPEEPPNDAGHEDKTSDFNARLRADEKLKGAGLAGYIEKRYVRADFYYQIAPVGIYKCVILNRRVVAHKEQTWRLPFFKQVFIQNPGMFCGTSMVEPLMPIQHDINKCLRLIRTQQDRAVNPDSVIDSTFFGSVEEAEMQPWGTGATILATRNAQGRDPQLARRFIYHPSNTAPDMWTSVQFQMQSGERSSGIPASDQGGAESDVTATAVARASAAVDIRGALIEVGIEDSIVVKPIEDLMLLIHANVSREKRVMIRGEEGEEWQVIRPQDMVFQSSPHVVALGTSSMAAQDIAAQSVRDVTLAFASNPLFAQFLKVMPGMRETYRMLGVDPDTYVDDHGLMDRVSVPPSFVPTLLASGKQVPINPWDDHEAVIAALVQYRNSLEWLDVPDENKELILKHIRLRKSAMAQKLSGGGLGAPSPASPYGGGGGGSQMMPQPGAGQGAPPVAQPPMNGNRQPAYQPENEPIEA